MSIKFSLQNTNKSNADQDSLEEWTACRTCSFRLTGRESKGDFVRVICYGLNARDAVIKCVRNGELFFDLINRRRIDGITHSETNTEAKNVIVIGMKI